MFDEIIAARFLIGNRHPKRFRNPRPDCLGRTARSRLLASTALDLGELFAAGLGRPRTSLSFKSYKEAPMLVLSRHRDESIMIGDDVVVTIVDIRGDKVRLGIEAPQEIPVHRQEVYEAIKRENRKASGLPTSEVRGINPEL
jgi:carbon storage regulator